MLTSIDFGITIIDILRKTKDGKFIHKMMESNEKPSEKLVKELFEDLNFSKDIELIALTGGHHQLIGNTIDETPIFHVNEVDAIVGLGIPGIMLFGIPENKDDEGTSAYVEHGIVLKAFSRPFFTAFCQKFLKIPPAAEF